MIFDLKLGFKCNNDCIHCVVADKRNSGCLSLEEMKVIVNTVPKGTYLQITGGEPTTFKEELPELLKYAYNRGLLCTMQTNGTGFADLEFLKLCAPYLDNVHIAIHSAYPEIHDKIVNSKGMWNLTMKGFHNLLEFPNIYVTTQTVLSKINIDSLYDTFTMIQEIAPGTQMSMTYPHMNGNAWKYRDQVAFRFSEKKDIIYKCLETFEDHLFTESIPPCYMYPFINHFSLEEDILSQDQRVGIDFSQSRDLHDYNISDIEERRKGPRCKFCIFNTCCIGVWKEYMEIFSKNLDLYPITQDKKEELDAKYRRS